MSLFELAQPRHFLGRGTVYGVYSTHGFYNHHSTQLSLALVKGDNESILSQISFDQTRFTRTGVPLATASGRNGLHTSASGGHGNAEGRLDRPKWLACPVLRQYCLRVLTWCL